LIDKKLGMDDDISAPMTSTERITMKTALLLCILFLNCTLPAQPSAPAEGVQATGVVLDKDWQSPLTGNAVSMKELASLLSPFFQPTDDTAPNPAIEIFNGVTYLMPWKEALQKLGISQSMPAKVQVACPGFPKDSFYDFVFAGSFDGDYNQLHLVTDSAGQVVCIELVCTAPKKRVTVGVSTEPWHTFDFIGNKTKAMSSVVVFHEAQYRSKTSSFGWNTYSPRSDSKGKSLDGIRIQSEAINLKRGFTDPYLGRLMQQSCLYVPKPLAELILFCARKNG
jgi:hypothetical protein